MILDIDSEVRYLIENSLDLKIEIDQLKGKKILNVELLWNGKPFAGNYIELENLKEANHV